MNGVPTRGIIEISGEAGSGKTQICLQLSLTVQLPEQFGGFEKGMSLVLMCRSHLIIDLVRAKVPHLFAPKVYFQRNDYFK